MAAPRAVMEVSWFGPGLHGNPMKSGRRFDMNDPTVAAHRSLPLGTVLRLMNPDNGRAIVVIVQDRGPFKEGRDLDISRAAAERIGIIKAGVKHLVVERIR